MGKSADPKVMIANRLRDARTLAGLSQGQVAEKMKWHRPTVTEIEAGRRNVSAEELTKLASLYGVSSAWLLGEEPAKEGEAADKLLLAARELSKIKEDDLERLVKVIHMLRSSSRN
jgi:transcriptional regulator with XRE-family HTH domain